MTQEKLIDAITDLDSDILNRYFDMKADLAAKKKPKKLAWMKWVSIAACFCLVFAIGFMVAPMFQNEPNIGDIEDNKVGYANIQEVEQVAGSKTLVSNIDIDGFDFSTYHLYYLNGKNEAPTVLEGEFSLGSIDYVRVYCSFPQYRGEMANIDHFLPSSVLPPDFPNNKGETEVVVPPTLLSTVVKNVDVSYYHYKQGDGFGGLGTFEVNEQVYVVEVFSADNENLLFEILSDLLD